MSLWKIAWRSIQQRTLASSLTALSMALGVALVVAVLVIYGVVQSSFTRAAHGYDLIVGAKGGKLQLVLNTVFHLSQPIENIPWSYYKEFQPGGRFASRVEFAIPYCLGDNYEGYRVVGTIPEMFSAVEYAPGKHYEFSAGENFKKDNYFDAVVGSVVARRTGLKVGDHFAPTHGISAEKDGHKHDEFHVVGILAPTGTPNDRAVFVNIEGFLLLDGHAKPVPKEEKPAATAPAPDGSHAGEHDHAHEKAHDEHAHGGEEGDHPPAAGEAQTAKQADDEHAHAEHSHADEHAHGDEHAHADEHAHHHDHDHDHGHHHHHHEPLPENQREVTAVLVKSTLVGGLSLPRTINKEQYAQAVFPVQEIQMLFKGLLGNFQMLLFGLALLVVIVSGISIMVSIYNSMNDRRNDIAVMRALGASRSTVMAIILLESILLAVGGGVAGVLIGHGLIAALDPIIEAQTGIRIGFLKFEWVELVLIPALVVLAAVVGYLPAVVAYRTDVAGALSERP
ncbi:MAG: ABC transporter permease [Planctomycetaceae bacterium]|nr:ABC transporter permease [Planctomycetaceae bacterium]